jgi:hypothetical protein
MRQLTMVVLLAAMGAVNVYSAEKTRVDVYISDRDESSQLLGPGKVMASGIFEKIGVRLNWRAGELNTNQRTANETLQKTFGIRTLEHAPDSATPGALASARIVGSSGTEIAVYKDRVQRFLENNRNLAALASAMSLPMNWRM